MEYNVIVAWDGSAPSKAALNWAARRQGSRPGTIRIVRIVDDDTLREDFADVDDAVTQAHQGLAAEAERIRLLAPAAHIYTDVILGDPERELRRLTQPGSLLVVGTHARDEHSARFGWSLGAQIAPATRGVLAIIPEHTSGERSGILVGVDGSEGSMSAALVAANEAVLGSQPLRAIHAWVEPVTGTGITGLNPEFVAWLKEANQELLDDSLQPVEKKFPELTVERKLENDLPVRAMREHAKSAALIVVGTRGYGPVRRLLLGSVSHSLILSIRCPIMVVGESALSEDDFTVYDESEEMSPRVARLLD